jgi:hypothetical protein
MRSAGVRTTIQALDEASGNYIPIQVDMQWQATGDLQHTRMRQHFVSLGYSFTVSSNDNFYVADATGEITTGSTTIKNGFFPVATIGRDSSTTMDLHR